MRKKKEILSNSCYWNPNQQRVYYLVLTGLFIGITMFSYFVLSFFKLPFLSGYSIPFELIIYIYSIIFLKIRYFKIFYFLVTPLLMLFIPGSYMNVLQTFFEYVLVYYCWGLFLLINFSNPKKDKRKKYIDFGFFVLFFFVSVILKFFIHIISGVIWWTPTNFELLGNLLTPELITHDSWITSFLINSPYVFLGMLIYMPVAFLLFFPLYNLFNSQKK